MPAKNSCLALLIALQVLATWAALGNWTLPYKHAFMSGIGDCQIAIAMLLATCGTLRWCVRLPVCGMFTLAGIATHYVCLVQTKYPMIFAEEYLVSVFLSVSILITILWLCRRRDLSLSVFERFGAVERRSDNQWALRDIFLWILTAGVVIAIGKQSVVLTDVSGMYDPWQTIEFATFELPVFVLLRLPLLLLALFVHGLAWTVTAMVILRAEKLRFSVVACALAIMFLLSIGELMVSSGYLLFRKPWPLLPSSTGPAINLFQYLHAQFEGRHDFSAIFWKDGWGLAVILATRATIYTSSLVLLYGAGFRFVRHISGAPQIPDPAASNVAN